MAPPGLLSLTILSLAVLLAGPVHGAPPAAHVPPPAAHVPPPAAHVPPPSVPTEPDVILALADPDEPACVWRDWRIQFSVVNGSLPSGIGVRSLTLSIPSMLAVDVRGRSAAGGSVELIPAALQLRTPGERRDFPPLELRATPLRELGWRALPVLMYRPRKEVFVATLRYEALADGQAGTRSAKLVVPVAAHPAGVYTGAVVGSLLAALFLVLPPLKREKRAGGGDTAPPEAYPARDFVVRFVRGTLVTAIAVLLLQSTSEFVLPVNLTVHDFYGGILLGLFGDKIGERLSRWLWG